MWPNAWAGRSWPGELAARLGAQAGRLPQEKRGDRHRLFNGKGGQEGHCAGHRGSLQDVTYLNQSVFHSIDDATSKLWLGNDSFGVADQMRLRQANVIT